MGTRQVPRPFTMPWGKGRIVEEASIRCPHWEPTIQLMEYEDGHQAIRFAYYHGPQFGRGPMILDEIDLERMGRALHRTPRLQTMLRKVVAADGAPP